MNIAIDISPLETGHYLQHRVRGTGFYLENLRKSLLEYCLENKYIFFKRGDSIGREIDVVHYPYFEPFFLTLPLFSKNKNIVTIHDLTPLVFPQHFKSGLKGKIKWEIQKRGLREARAIITDSISSKKDIVKYAGINESKIRVIYLASGLEFKKIQNLESKGLDLRNKYKLPEKFALYVGDVTWNKNLPRLIEAVNKIKATLVMVGKALTDSDFDRSNPWNKDLVKVQELAQSSSNIIRLGFVPTEDLVLLYNMASVFTMPSLYEGFGLPILEAMSCGCPVVASKEGSVPEIVGNAAKYVNAYSTDDIALGIKAVLDDPELQKDLSRRGIVQAAKFTWQKTAKQTTQVYKQALG